MHAPLQSLYQPPMLVRTAFLTQESASASFTKEGPERQLVGVCSGSVSVYRQRCYQLEMPGSSHLCPYYLLQSTQTFLWLELCWGWTSPWGSYYDCKKHLSNHQQGTSKKQGYYSQVLEGTLYIPGHTTRLQIEKQREGLGIRLYWGQGWGAQAFLSSLFIGKLKT